MSIFFTVWLIFIVVDADFVHFASVVGPLQLLSDIVNSKHNFFIRIIEDFILGVLEQKSNKGYIFVVFESQQLSLIILGQKNLATNVIKSS